MRNKFEHMIQKYRQRFLLERLQKIDINASEGPLLVKINEFKTVKLIQLIQDSPFHKSHITRTIHQLSEKGYLLKTVDSNDMRGYVLQITEKGCAVANQVMAFLTEWEHLLQGGLDEHERETLNRLTEKMYRHVKQYFEEEDTA